METPEPVQPCKCLSECPVELVLHDKSMHLACKHMLMNMSQYFDAMFRVDLKEKQTNRVDLQDDVSKSDLKVFLDVIHDRFKPLPNDAAALRSLIFLADRFMCPSLEKGILPILTNGSLFRARAQSKLELLETADKHRGNSTDILEACVRLCADVSLDQVSSLHGKITDGTLAAVLLLVGKAKGETAEPVKVMRRHLQCGGQLSWNQNGSWKCGGCRIEGVDIEEIVRFEYKANTFQMVQKIPINKKMFG